MSYTHKAFIPLDGPPRPECGGTGRCVVRSAEVDCPDCLQLDADRQARALDVVDEPVDGPESPLMMPDEVADVFRVSKKTPNLWAKAGLITRIWTPGGRPRYLREEIEALLAQGHSTPPFLRRAQ